MDTFFLLRLVDLHLQIVLANSLTLLASLGGIGWSMLLCLAPHVVVSAMVLASLLITFFDTFLLDEVSRISSVSLIMSFGICENS